MGGVRDGGVCERRGMRITLMRSCALCVLRVCGGCAAAGEYALTEYGRARKESVSATNADVELHLGHLDVVCVRSRVPCARELASEVVIVAEPAIVNIA